MIYDKATYHRWIGSRFAIGLLVATLFSVNALNAQQDDSNVQDSSRAPDAFVQPILTQNGWDPNATPAEPSDAPKVISLESGLPLRAKLSPVHWGHLSLFAANLVGAYDSNFEMRQPAVWGQETFLSGLIVYSIQNRRSQLDLQYMPIVWAANGQLGSNFTSQAVDLTHSRSLSRSWTLGLHDQFRYSPNQFYWTNSTFSPDFASGTATSNPIFLVNRNALLNNFDLQLDHKINERDQLAFSFDEGFVRLSQNADTTAATSAVSGVDEQLTSTASVRWTRTLNERSTMGVNYRFQHQYNPYSGESIDYQNAGITYTRQLRPSIGLSLEAGPSWSHQFITLQGSLALFKSFHNGGIAASLSRGTNFTGLISSSYNNRYDLSFSRLVHRLEFQASYSYVQQSYLNARQTDGGLINASIGYRLTRNWSAYSSYYYFNSSGSQSLFGPRQVMAAGIRWAWTPAYKR